MTNEVGIGRRVGLAFSHGLKIGISSLRDLVSVSALVPGLEAWAIFNESLRDLRDVAKSEMLSPANGLVFETPRDNADVLFSNRAEFGTEETLKIIPVRSPNNSRWFVILMDGNLLRQMKPNERTKLKI